MVDVERDWLAEVRKLPADRVFVQHNPPTPRYGRAQTKLSYVIREAVLLGTRAVPHHPSRLEIAAWARRPSGRGYGYYVCFRLFFALRELNVGVLFCFYDGTDGSPGFKSVDAASQFAASQGFEVSP